MDSGCTAFDPEGEEEFDSTKDASAEEIIWLMDELLYREVAWHMGYPLSQTLFTSIHIERLLWPEPKRLSDAGFWRNSPELEYGAPLLHNVFQPYCLSLIKCCDLVLSLVTSQHYYEEEDFATQIFNRPLLHEFAAEEIMDLLQAARSWLDSSDIPPHLARALDARLDARSALLVLFHDCSYGERPSPQALGEHTTLLKVMEESAFLGRPTSSVSFTLKIQRRLASSVPPRPMIVIQKEKTFPFLRQLVTDAITSFEILDIASSNDLHTAYQNFMAQAPQPAVYVRALLQSFLNIDGKVIDRFSLKDFITQDVRSLVLPSGRLFEHSHMNDLPEDQQIELGSRVDLFLDRCGQSFLNLFRTLCLNRCRVRRTMCHAALEWDQIQAEAEELDILAQSILSEPALPYPAGEEPTFAYSFSSWVYHYKLVQLGTVLQMGFELSIYAPHEFAGVYWYLSFLASTHLNHLERISFFVASAQRSNNSRHDEVQSMLKNLYRHFTWLKSVEAMAKALHRVFTLLQRHGQFQKPIVAYASETLRYELRMRPFLHLSVPEPINVDVARQSSSLSELSDREVLEQALKLIQTARKAWEEVLKAGWNFSTVQLADTKTNAGSARTSKSLGSVVDREWTQDVRNSIRACIGTSIVITGLMKVVPKGAHQPATVIANMAVDIPAVGDRDRWHLNWPVPKITS
ncbi:N-alpha-acetyltransferase, non-catalitic subunit [Cladophialophora chaetospira]|uniref:N-alpha-acetyltransferase, non-catalitic subunit n=1 Tax=Cladophialophora chaetospira TaxID=386627 RepID=A0AA38X0F8_9EURO|nr:N-alpha-acetyltransferase, non-catalitic subunit [Cladophialophora chaetospira]